MSQYLSAWNNVRGIERMSLCDWPGRASCVLFVGGCNLHCPTCHNGGMAWRPARYPVVPRERVLSYLERRKIWLDGITVTGGEPSIVGDIAGLLADLGRVGLPIKMDSNGMRPDVLESILNAGLVQVFAVDVKGPWDKYPALTGDAVSAEEARKAMEGVFALAERRPESFYFRTTKVPLLTAEDLDAVRASLPAGFSLTEQTYVPPGRSQHAKTDPEEGRLPRDVVPGPHRAGHSQSAQSQRHQGPAALQAAGA
ncbi:anaerobic ribonucleoside-triphosphate reductase activating protein [Desulfocurvus sp. DL9XJH121]